MTVLGEPRSLIYIQVQEDRAERSSQTEAAASGTGKAAGVGLLVQDHTALAPRPSLPPNCSSVHRLLSTV